MVIKPAPTTPLTTLRFAELASRFLPDGVINVICDENDLGAKLTCHPGVDKIAFTGSTETGRKVLESAADGIKRVTLELGGNDAALRSEEHTSELQSLMRNSSAVFCLTKNKKRKSKTNIT